MILFFFNDTATTEIYTLSLHDALPIYVTDPARPVLLGRTPTSDAATSVAVDGRYAFVADGVSGLQVADVSDPAHPRIVGSQGLFGNSGYFFGVAVEGGRAVVADIINGV